MQLKNFISLVVLTRDIILYYDGGGGWWPLKRKKIRVRGGGGGKEKGENCTKNGIIAPKTG